MLENTERGNEKCTIQRKWLHGVQQMKKNKNTTQYVLDTNYGQANTNIVNKI